MKDPGLSIAEMRLRIHCNRIQSQISPVAMHHFRQIAWSFRARLSFLLATPDWQNRLHRELRSTIEQAGVDIAGMSVEDAVMLMYMLLSEDAREDMKDMLQDMEVTRKQRAQMREEESLEKPTASEQEARKLRKKVREILIRHVHEIEARIPKWPPR